MCLGNKKIDFFDSWKDHKDISQIKTSKNKVLVPKKEGCNIRTTHQKSKL